MECCYSFVDTPLGRALVAAQAGSDALSGFWFVGQKYYPQVSDAWREDADYPVFVALRRWLKSYFAGEVPRLDFPLAPKGTAFQEKVWSLLLEIPHGQLSSYGALAQRMTEKGLGGSARAVGGAVGHNPISVLIPCHRVLGAGGKLTGYAGGLDKKVALLRLEGAIR